jgi:predicted DCC family thiol-disulfide oxidoreductase YuxK
MTSIAKQLQERSNSENIIFYDGDCIYCKKYAELVRLRESLGMVKLVNLRDDPEAVKILRGAGFEPNEGMAFVTGEALHWGSDAVLALALLSRSTGVVNSVQKTIFRNKFMSKTIYPVLKLGRSVTLRLRGKTYIP